ncbi:Coiled-coil domain-containing protein 77, partial [Podochytrium sp. JEL0797]
MSAAAAFALADNNISLVEYYKARLERVEADFQTALDSIDALKIPHKEHHALAWQVHRREAEVADIQQALSDAQVQVFDERKQLLRVIAENDELKIQELKDRKKIRYLLSMTGNTTPDPEVTYFRDRLHKRLVKMGPESKLNEPPSTTPHTTDPHSILLLEDELTSLRLTISSLHTHLSEQSTSYEEIIAGLHRDRDVRVEEERIRRQHEHDKMKELMERNDNLRALSRENVRELLYLKKTLHQNERRLVEEKTRLTNEILTLKSQYTHEKERVDHVEKAVEAKLVRKHQDVTADLRLQLQKSQEELREVKTKAQQ